MTAEYPYRVFCLFRGDPSKRTFYVGVSAKDITDADSFRLITDTTLPKKPSKLWARRESLQAFPHLPFVLADEIIPTCPPFEPLQVAVVPRSDQGRHHYYGLSKERCQAWKTLEEKLKIVTQGLFRFAHKNNLVNFVKSFNPSAEDYLPSAWGYDNVFPSQHDALQVLHHSLAGYQLLMAQISYGITLARKEDDIPGNPQWAIYLQDRCKLDGSFVDAIKASPMNNFTRPRVGAFVKEGSIDRSWAEHIKYMERARCPIYIHWHSETSWAGEFTQIMAKYKPSHELIRQAANPNPFSAPVQRSLSPSLMSSCSTYDRPPSSLATSVDDNVDVFRDQPDDYDKSWESAGPSGQRPGESMEDFFARRETEKSRTLSLMNAKCHQAVLSRRKYALDHGFSAGKKAAHVYVWQTNSITRWIKRVWVTRDLALDAFESYTDATRRYDPINNCWDCYSGWATEEIPKYYLDDTPDVLQPPIPSIRRPPSPPPLRNAHTSLASTAPVASSAPSSSHPQHISNNDIVMGDAAPFVPHPEYVPILSIQRPPTPPPVGDVQTVPVASSAPSSSHPHHISDNDIVMGDAAPFAPHPEPVPILSIQRPPTPPPVGDVQTVPVLTAPSPPSAHPIVCDFQEAFLDTLCCRYGFIPGDYSGDPTPLEIEEGEVEDGEIESAMDQSLYHAMLSFIALVHHQRFITFARMMSEGRSIPQLWDLDPSSPNRLPLPPISPSDGVSINRLHTTGGDILYHIMPPLDHGFAKQYYRLAVPSAATALECYRRDFTSTPFAVQRLLDRGIPFRTLMVRTRRKWYSPPRPLVLPHRNLAYQFGPTDFIVYEALRDRFFQYPHARAALLEGGIVWRLAKECLDVQLAVNGPSDFANDFGDVVRLPDGTELVDDSFAIDARDLICGTYIVYTGAFIICICFHGI